MQATEALKIILGAPDIMVNRLLLFDAWRMRFRELKLRKNPECPVCGDNPTITELIDYEEFCGITQQPETKPTMEEITAKELKERSTCASRTSTRLARSPAQNLFRWARC
nr:MoeZ/MoeB domain protein [uncultured bacterium]